MIRARQPRRKKRCAFLYSHLSSTRILQRQPGVFLDQRLHGQAERLPRQADHDLVLQQRVAELHELFPARTGHAEIARMVRGSVGVEVRVPAQQRDHLVDPGPAAEGGDDAQLREVHGDLVQMARMAKVVWPVVGVVHVGVDAHRDVQLHAFRVERVVAAVAGRNHVVERRNPHRPKTAFLHQAHQLAHAAHAVVRADRRQPDEALGILRENVADELVAGAQHADLDAGAIHQGDEGGNRHAVLLGGFGRPAGVSAPREDALVVGEAVARRRLQPLRIAVAGRVRRRFEFSRFAGFVRGQVAFEIDDFSHVPLPTLHDDACPRASAGFRMRGLPRRRKGRGRSGW